jgi:mono/diheme cytochrome c family protein
MLAATNVTAVVLLVLGTLLIALSIGALVLRQRARGRGPEVPYTMRPGPSDAALETPLLQRLQGWSVVLVVFFVVWFPLQWLIEPDRNFSQEEALRTAAIDRGSRAILPYSEENQLGVGCTRCHGPELKGGVIPYQDGYAYPPDLTNICAGNLGDPAHPAIASLNDIYQVIYQGRNAMPSWSIRYQGALTDQQINDIVMYLVDMSSKNVPNDQNICLNADAQKQALEKAAADGTVLERP